MLWSVGSDTLHGEVQLLKYKHIFLLFLAIMGTSSHAERRVFSGGGNKKLSGILYGGFAFTSHKSEGAGNVQGQTGLAFGLGAEYKIMSQISLGIDMLYNQKGYQLRNGSSVTQYDLSYLEFPIWVKWNPFREMQFKVGPYLAGMMVAATRQVSGTETPLKSEFANDFGVSFGSWIGFWANPQLAVGVDLRYDMGLANIQNIAEPSYAIRSRAFTSTLSLVFGLK